MIGRNLYFVCLNVGGVCVVGDNLKEYNIGFVCSFIKYIIIEWDLFYNDLLCFRKEYLPSIKTYAVVS